MKQSLGKITLDQVLNNGQVLLTSIARKGGNGRNRRKVDCATRIARHKLTVYKKWFNFSQPSCMRIKI